MTKFNVIEEFYHALQPDYEVEHPQVLLTPPPVKLYRPFAGGIIVSTLLMLAFGAITYAILRLDNVQDIWRQAYESSSNLQSIKATMLDAETGQRGYVITGEKNFLEPFVSSMSQIKPELVKLNAAFSSKPAQLDSLAHIENLWQRKTTEMQHTISLAQSGHRAAAVAIVQNGSGKTLMDGIRGELDMVGARNKASTEKAAQNYRLWRGLLLEFGLIALIIAAVTAYLEILRTRRYIKAMASFQSSALSLNAKLEEAVAMRTQSFSRLTAILQAVMATTKEAIYAKDTECRMIFANDATLKVIGLNREQIIGRRDTEFHDNKEHALIANTNDRRIMASGESEIIEELYGHEQDVRVHLSHKAPLKNSRGDVIGIVGVSSDITQQKLTNDARILSERRFRAAIDVFDGIIWTADKSGNVTMASLAWTKLTGQSMQDAVGFGWNDFLHPDDVEPTRHNWLQALSSLQPFNGEYRVRDVQGHYHIFAVRALPIFDDEQRVLEWVGLNLDITTGRQTQNQLEEALERLDIAFDAAQMGSYEFIPADPHASVFDKRIYAIWGVPETADAKTFMRAVHVDDQVRVRKTLKQLEQSTEEQYYEMEYRILQPGGEQRWIIDRGRVVVSPGSTIRLIGTARDFTERKNHEERIYFLVRELSHRTSNTLSVIQSLARLTVSKADNLETFSKSFEARLHGMAQSLKLLVNDNWDGSNIRDIIHSQLGHFYDKQTDKIVTTGPDLLLQTEAAQNIGLALHELATNAAKYGALSVPEGKVYISWQIVKDEHSKETFELQWRESSGPAVMAPKTQGFGHTVIQRIVKAALSGKSDLLFDTDGVRWNLSIASRFIVLNFKTRRLQGADRLQS